LLHIHKRCPDFLSHLDAITRAMISIGRGKAQRLQNEVNHTVNGLVSVVRTWGWYFFNKESSPSKSLAYPPVAMTTAAQKCGQRRERRKRIIKRRCLRIRAWSRLGARTPHQPRHHPPSKFSLKEKNEVEMKGEREWTEKEDVPTRERVRRRARSEGALQISSYFSIRAYVMVIPGNRS
jgi:hypothetical protein